MHADERDFTLSPLSPGFSHESRGATALAAAPELTREQLRSRRKRPVRARTINVNRVSQRELELGRILYPEHDHERPRTRAECVDGPRPCPFVSCKHHLYVDVSTRTGAIKLNFPDLEVWELGDSCALDVADRGGATLEDVGAIMNLTRERIRQVEVTALAKIEALRDMANLRDFVDEGPADERAMGKRRLPPVSEQGPGSARARGVSARPHEAPMPAECVPERGRGSASG